ncbi:MAG: hypothetical protein HYU64_21420 [Armatimonadetes bacterium]|nr:hypothetical protein [Armatimonadota bacterium]
MSESALQSLPERGDVFEPDGIIPEGPFSGKKVDTHVVRSLKLLSLSEAAPYHPEPGDRLVANFRHNDHWWIARIPDDAVQDVIFQQELAPPGRYPNGHAQIRFTMKPGKEITLIPQVPGDCQDASPIKDIIFSADGNRPKGVSGMACPLKGIEQAIVAYLLMSLDQKCKIMTENGKLHKVNQFKLPLSDEAEQEVLKTALHMGTRGGMHEMFNFLTRNCTTQAITVLDDSLNYGFISEVLSRITWNGSPNAIPFYLFERGLLNGRAMIPDLEREMRSNEPQLGAWPQFGAQPNVSTR